MLSGADTPDWELESRSAKIFVALGAKGLPILREAMRSDSHVDGPGGPYWIITPKVTDLLVRIGNDAIPCLLDALNDEHPHVRKYSAKALKRITGQSLRADYETWRDWWREYGILEGSRE